MEAVGRIVPVLPVPLMASVFVAQPQRALSALELKAEVGRLLDAPGGGRARTSTSRAATSTTRSPSACACCTLRRLVEEQDGLFRAREAELPLLAYYANSITHLL